MSLTLNIGKCSLLGNYRENNEDAIEVKQYPDFVVTVVADGMGGQAAGEVASGRAIDILPRELRKHMPNAGDADSAKYVIRQAVVTANKEIITMAETDRDKRNMGTTVVLAVWRRSDELYIAHVGDSRAYLTRDGQITQLTVDHSLAEALVQANTLSRDEAKGHRFQNVLWKYLGTKEVGEGPDVTVLPVRAGDRLLLCTDGLCGVVPDEKLLEAMGGWDDSQACADGLCQLALDSGSRDNVSCVVIDVA